MIVNIHPKEIFSFFSVKIIEDLKNKYNEEIVYISDKTPKEWQDIINSNIPIRFVGPVYWWGVGYEMEKWMQEVFTHNFAFTYNDHGAKGLLKNRNFEIHLVHGNPVSKAKNMRDNIEFRLKDGVFRFMNADLNVFFYDKNDIK